MRPLGRFKLGKLWEALQFMKFAIVFFVLCSAAEMVKFLLPGAHPKVGAMISVPPLDEENFKEYGEVQIIWWMVNSRTKNRPWITHNFSHFTTTPHLRSVSTG